MVKKSESLNWIGCKSLASKGYSHRGIDTGEGTRYGKRPKISSKPHAKPAKKPVQ